MKLCTEVFQTTAELTMFVNDRFLEIKVKDIIPIYQGSYAGWNLLYWL